jgi:dienelactone hydrolase
MVNGAGARLERRGGHSIQSSEVEEAMGTDNAVTPIEGVAAGVPYVALAPTGDRDDAPLVVVWHLMDPPRSEAAMAAALPLAGLNAWRVYLGLPMFGARAPAGGPDEIMRLAADDYVLKLFGPAVEQAAAEAPSAVDALREQLSIDTGPVGLVGGSAGGAVALLLLAESQLPVAAAALVNPVVKVRSVVEAGERMYNVSYSWTEKSAAVADRFDFVERAAEIGKRDPQPPVLLVGGAEDDPGYQEALAGLRDALAGHYAEPDRVGFVSVPGMAHAIAEEPGMEAAPQTAEAKEVDAAETAWFQRYL